MTADYIGKPTYRSGPDTVFFLNFPALSGKHRESEHGHPQLIPQCKLITDI